MTDHGGRAQPTGRVSVRRVATPAHRFEVRQLLNAMQLPDDARVWAQVDYEDGEAMVTVRAATGDVIGQVVVDAPAELRRALEAVVAEHRDAARDDLKRGLAYTMAAAFAGRNEG